MFKLNKIAFQSFLLFSLSACQFKLFPDYKAPSRYTLNTHSIKLDLDCSDSDFIIYYSGARVSDPYQGKKLIYETLSGEVLSINNVEWVARFENLLSNAFEQGLRRSFIEDPNIIILSSESGIESNISISFRVERIYLKNDNNKKLSRKKIYTKALLRIVDDINQKEDYQILNSYTIIKSDDPIEYARAIQTNIKKLSLKSYEYLQKKICN